MTAQTTESRTAFGRFPFDPKHLLVLVLLLITALGGSGPVEHAVAAFDLVERLTPLLG